MLKADGFVFHRPCTPQTGDVAGDSTSVESKPKGSKEPTLAVARAVIVKYLADKPRVAAYQWPPKSRPILRHRHEDVREVFRD